MLVVFGFSFLFYLVSVPLRFPLIHGYVPFLRCLVASGVFTCLRIGSSQVAGNSGCERGSLMA